MKSPTRGSARMRALPLHSIPTLAIMPVGNSAVIKPAALLSTCTRSKVAAHTPGALLRFILSLRQT